MVLSAWNLLSNGIYNISSLSKKSSPPVGPVDDFGFWGLTLNEEKFT